MRMIGRLAILLVVAACSPAEPAVSEGERLLLAGTRLDLQGKCDPLRDGLPPRAVAAIKCTPDHELVLEVRLHLFDSQADLLDAYAAWLATNAIAPRTLGRCGPGRPSERSWEPEDGPKLIPKRAACVVEPDGSSRHVVTLPPFVLAEVDGTGDPKMVYLFAWLGDGHPSAPTLWQGAGRLSPEN